MKTHLKSLKPLLIGRFEIVLGKQSVTYYLKRSPRAHLIWLHISRENGLTVTIPSYYHQNDVPVYLNSRSSWILRHLKRIETDIPSSGKPELTQIELYYKGNQLQCFQEGNKKIYSLPDGLVADYNGVLNWLRQQALHIIPNRVLQYSKTIRVNFSKIRIRDQKTRWGSCSHKGNLNFNWRLIMAPEPVLDYVVIHELCHLKRMNHGKAFWNEVSKHCTDWKEKRHWLNKHSRELHYFHSNSV